MPVETRTTTSHSIPRTSGEKFSEAELEKTSPIQDAAAEEHPTGASLAIITIGLFLAVLCFGLDRSILGTAIPVITSEFESLPDVAWYGSAYLFTMCSFQLFFGKLYAEFNAKWVFLVALFIFEVGSIVCAVAPSSVVLIIGRAISGVGAAGLMSGALIILARSVPLHRRPQFTAAVGAAGGISQCIAPTLGGVFVDKATWRWCFWINLPLGGVTFLVVLFLLKLPAPPKKETQSVREFISNFDLVGTLLIIPWIICLLLALQWGGTEYPWSTWRIVLCWCLFAVCFLSWAFVQYREGDKATVPFRILFQRSMACACWLMLLLFSLLFIEVYYIPIWLQAVKNHSAYQSGIDLLASSVSLSVATILSGFLTSHIGYYVPQLIASSVITSVGTGLIYSFNENTNSGFWIASLIVLGVGVGLGGQQTLIAVQTVFQGRDVALATSLLIFLQSLGGTVFLAVAQNIFHSRLIFELNRNVPNVDPAVVIDSGGSGLVESMRRIYPDSVDGIVGAYNKALQNVFLIATVLGCLTFFGCVFIEWKSVKKDKPKKEGQTQGQTKRDGDAEK
ncbi:major facilitator superfamily transporter [Colletotrichum godetiae]|uniref:Major facilitator superfamily transporter n=1 Tax=Colletotrichum godetiae TaxID=1209918 RepID=A0AAJ0EWC4_9PEZI|nr:major facilitator superfamily transporter [Colletotrichum godetiae]KAK1674095.1 major facilitator superfamily transporter [Colletotrichum godetiae]